MAHKINKEIISFITEFLAHCYSVAPEERHYVVKFQEDWYFQSEYIS